MNPEVLSHEPDCQCDGCKKFFWELLMANDEREVMEADVKRLGLGPDPKVGQS
jgi:hypothetical protein